MSDATDSASEPEPPRAAGAADRTDLWLPLLRRLTDACPSWLVYKNADSAFRGTGDIDAAAPAEAWPILEREFVAWAANAGLGPVIVCRHVPGGLLLVAVPPTEATFLEMGVNAWRVWRGAVLFDVHDILPMSIEDPRGFRRLRPGAEGVIKLVFNGIGRSGAENSAALEVKDVRSLLRSDPDGVAEAIQRFRLGRPFLRSGARSAAHGGWSRPAMLAFELTALIDAVVHPRKTFERLRFRRGPRATCPVIQGINAEGRRVPADRAGWLLRASQDHAVYALDETG
jgi:hypothetical protein